MPDYSWVNLKNICPIDIDPIIKHSEYVETIICSTLKIEELDKQKEKLIQASAELEIMITKLISLLYDIDTIKTEIDKAIYVFLKDDMSGYIGLIDEKQNKLLEVHDGETLSGVSRTSAFKKILYVSLYGIIYNSLYFASIEYNNFKPTETIKKDKSVFLRIFFLILSINMSTLGGLQRRKSSGGGIIKNNSVPAQWRTMFTKEGNDDIKTEYKERYGEELREDLPFESKDLEEHFEDD